MADLKQDSTLSRGDYEQVKWERDCAIQQLQEDYGVGLGEMKPENLVEVVFCKDCKYMTGLSPHVPMSKCEILKTMVFPEDFCSYGERRKKDDGKGMAE